MGSRFTGKAYIGFNVWYDLGCLRFKLLKKCRNVGILVVSSCVRCIQVQYIPLAVEFSAGKVINCDWRYDDQITTTFLLFEHNNIWKHYTVITWIDRCSCHENHFNINISGNFQVLHRRCYSVASKYLNILKWNIRIWSKLDSKRCETSIITSRFIYYGHFNALFSRILLAFVKCRSDGFSFKCRFDIWGEKYSRVGFPFEDYFRVGRLELFFLFKWLFGQFYSFFHERKFCWAMLKVNHRNLLCLKIVCCLCCLICTIITVYYVLDLDS